MPMAHEWLMGSGCAIGIRLAHMGAAIGRHGGRTCVKKWLTTVLCDEPKCNLRSPAQTNQKQQQQPAHANIKDDEFSCEMKYTPKIRCYYCWPPMPVRVPFKTAQFHSITQEIRRNTVTIFHKLKLCSMHENGHIYDGTRQYLPISFARRFVGHSFFNSLDILFFQHSVVLCGVRRSGKR